MKVLVTGGSGFLGREVVKALLVAGHQVAILDRNEETIRKCLDAVDGQVDVVVGDIRDEETVKRAVNDQDAMIHLAAMKHIDFAQANPREAVLTNVVGTMNLLEQFWGKTFLAMSSDKAASPTTTYGHTKYLMERLVLEKGRWCKEGRYMVARSGNIFGSSGSVIEKWRTQLQERDMITVTQQGMTRYFITAEDLSFFLGGLLLTGKTGQVYIPAMKSLWIDDLAQAVIARFGTSWSRIEYTGLREGEKVHERVFAPGESVITDLREETSESEERMSVEEIAQLLEGVR